MAQPRTLFSPLPLDTLEQSVQELRPLKPIQRTEPPGPLDRLSAYFAKGEPPPLPPAPPKVFAPTTNTTRSMAQPRIPVQDTRDVPANARVAGNYPQGTMEDVAREAMVAGVPPDLALAMAIRESSSYLANPQSSGERRSAEQNPLTLNFSPRWAAHQWSEIEPAMMHAVERASAVAPQGRERQIQAYNGLGAQAPGYNERFAGQPNPYARAVEEIKDRVVNASPALRSLMANVTPTLSLAPMRHDKIAAVSDTIGRRIRNPDLWK